MIDNESDPGSWNREIERLGTHGPRVIGEDERSTLLETIRRLEARLVAVESANAAMRLALEGVGACSSCDVCAGAATTVLANTRR